MKLIFPFKYLSTCISVLPKKYFNFLDSPSTYIIGVLSSTISTKELNYGFPEKIIVDCDTNEIFGYSNLEPFEPPKAEQKGNDGADKLIQGKNKITIDKNMILKYKKKKKKMNH